MTHDPLCVERWFTPDDGVPCICALIAKVRADTLDKARCAVSDVFWPTNGTWVSGKTTFDNLGRACLHAIDGLRGE